MSGRLWRWCDVNQSVCSHLTNCGQNGALPLTNERKAGQMLKREVMKGFVCLAIV